MKKEKNKQVRTMALDLFFDGASYRPVVDDKVETARYYISEYGDEIFDAKRNKPVCITRPEDHISTYAVVRLRGEDGKASSFYVHRLMYQSWYGPISEGYTVDHVDVSRHNFNHLQNIRLLPCKENLARHEVKRENQKYKVLTNLKFFKSLKEAADELHCHPRYLYLINAYWRKRNQTKPDGCCIFTYKGNWIVTLQVQ